jgi:hypothetical protein
MTDAIDGVGATRATSRTAALAATMAMLAAQAFQDDDGSAQGQQPAGGLDGMLQQLMQVLQQAGQALQQAGQAMQSQAPASSGVQGTQGAGGAGAQGGGLMQALQALMQMLMAMTQDDSPMESDPQAQQLASGLNPSGAQAPSPPAPGGAGGGAGGGTVAGVGGGAGAPQAASGPAGVTQSSATPGSGKAPAGMPADQWQGCMEASKKTGIDPYILAAQAKQESQFGQALSGSPSAGDGVMQVEPSTRQAYAGKFQQAMGHAYDHSSVKDQIAMAAVILKDKGGSATNMLEKYNGGDNWAPGATDSYGRPILADQYAAKVQASAEQMKAGG